MAKSKETAPKTSADFEQRAKRHRQNAEQLRGQLESKQAEVQAAVRAEQSTEALRAELRELEQQLGDTEAAAAADETEAKRLRLLEQAKERRETLAQLDKLREQYDGVDSDTPLAQLAEAIAERQALEQRVREAMGTGHRGSVRWRVDHCQRDTAGYVMGGLSSVLREGAFVNSRSLDPAERDNTAAWAHARKVIAQQADELDAGAAEIAERDDEK